MPLGPGSDSWTPLEKQLFEEAFSAHQKDFSLIQKKVKPLGRGGSGAGSLDGLKPECRSLNCGWESPALKTRVCLLAPESDRSAT